VNALIFAAGFSSLYGEYGQPTNIAHVYAPIKDTKKDFRGKYHPSILSQIH